eukprot:3817463-Amphidinium_carterae.1
MFDFLGGGRGNCNHTVGHAPIQHFLFFGPRGIVHVSSLDKNKHYTQECFGAWLDVLFRFPDIGASVRDYRRKDSSTN